MLYCLQTRCYFLLRRSEPSTTAPRTPACSLKWVQQSERLHTHKNEEVELGVPGSKHGLKIGLTQHYFMDLHCITSWT